MVYLQEHLLCYYYTYYADGSINSVLSRLGTLLWETVEVGSVNTSQVGFMTQLTHGRKNTRLTHFTLSPTVITCMHMCLCVCVFILPVIHKSVYILIFSALFNLFNLSICLSLSLIPFGLCERLPSIENYFDLSPLLNQWDQPQKIKGRLIQHEL